MVVRRQAVREKDVARTPPLDPSGGAFLFWGTHGARVAAGGGQFLHKSRISCLTRGFQTCHHPHQTSSLEHQTTKRQRNIYEKKNIRWYIVMPMCRAHGLRNGLRTTAQDEVWALSWSDRAHGGGAGCSVCHRAFLFQLRY